MRLKSEAVVGMERPDLFGKTVVRARVFRLRLGVGLSAFLSGLSGHCGEGSDKSAPDGPARFETGGLHRQGWLATPSARKITFGSPFFVLDLSSQNTFNHRSREQKDGLRMLEPVRSIVRPAPNRYALARRHQPAQHTVLTPVSRWPSSSLSPEQSEPSRWMATFSPIQQQHRNPLPPQPLFVLPSMLLLFKCIISHKSQ